MKTDSLSEFRKHINEGLQEITVTERLRSQTIRRMYNRLALPSFGLFIRRMLPLGITAMLFFTIGLLAPLDKEHPNVSEPNPGNEWTEIGTPEINIGLDSFAPLVDLPAYVPDGYQLKQLIAAPQEERSELVYAAEDAAFTLTLETKPLFVDMAEFRKVDIPHIEAWIRHTASKELELRWSKQNKHYRLTGTISAEEAIKVAESL